jgi:hypothetical protein
MPSVKESKATEKVTKKKVDGDSQEKKVVKEPKKISVSKLKLDEKKVKGNGQVVSASPEATDQETQSKASSGKKVTKKASISKVQTLITEEPKVEQASEVLAEETNKTKQALLLTLETNDELVLFGQIEEYAKTIGAASLQEAIVKLMQNGLNSEQTSPDKVDALEAKLDKVLDGFKGVEDKFQSELYSLKVEFIEQFQCLVEACRNQPEDATGKPQQQKNWLQNILRYI